MRVTVGLVATETSVNGAPPAITVQGLTTMLDFAFAERQRTGTVTDR